jgi:hypothetical protein
MQKSPDTHDAMGGSPVILSSQNHSPGTSSIPSPLNALAIKYGGLASEGKLKHLGVSDSPKRSTLSYANANRPWSLYQTVFEQLLSKCQLTTAGHGKRKKFRFKNKLVSLDSSVIDLSLSLFDWAQFRRTKGAVKHHLLLDHDGYLPSFAVVTNGKTSDIKVAQRLRFERGTVVVMDRGYIDYEWFVQLTHQGVYFVTRLK